MDEQVAFYDQVLSRVIHFTDHGGYGQKVRTAARSIRKKYPDKSLAECEAAFTQMLAVYAQATHLVLSHEAEFWAVYQQSGGKAVVPDQVRREFELGHPALPPMVLTGMLVRIFYWRHLR